jgi:hypothetical protein
VCPSRLVAVILASAGLAPSLQSRPGPLEPGLNVDAELEKLRQTLQADFDAVAPVQ